jgi:alcohol dehydrogenase, propanol-preferring
MRAQVLAAPGRPLAALDLPEPEPGPGEILLAIEACGVCRTDLHVVDGELPDPKLPLVPGHQIVARVAALGPGASRFAVGARVGVPWLAWACGRCRFCRRGRENLCPYARFTGYQKDGGYAERCVADEAFAFALPDGLDSLQAAPLLCAGLIGWRALKLAGDAERLGLYGFGASAHIVIQLARARGQEVYGSTRPGDAAAQAFARDLGAVWAGGSDEKPPEPLDAAILFAPAGDLVPLALRAVDRGGVVVCAGIHMSDVPSFPYEALWGERVLRSVANLTRRDGEEFLRIAAEARVRAEVRAYTLERAGDALDDLRHGRFTGAAVLDVAAGARR